MDYDGVKCTAEAKKERWETLTRDLDMMNRITYFGMSLSDEGEDDYIYHRRCSGIDRNGHDWTKTTLGDRLC